MSTSNLIERISRQHQGAYRRDGDHIGRTRFARDGRDLSHHRASAVLVERRSSFPIVDHDFDFTVQDQVQPRSPLPTAQQRCGGGKLDRSNSSGQGFLGAV